MMISLCDSEALSAELVTAEHHGGPGGDVLFAHVHGELDLSTAPALDQALQRYLDTSHARRMLLDLRDVTFLGCHGVTVLVRLARRAMTHEGCERPCLIGLSSTGKRVLQLVELIDMFSVHDTIDGAVVAADEHRSPSLRVLEGVTR